MNITSKKALEKLVALCGGQSALAKKIKISQQSISEWLLKGKVPAHRVIQLEKAVNGAVARYDLRPDIYPREE